MKPLVLKVMTRGETVFEGEIESLSSVNEKGKFDVLRRHANFISMISNYLVITESGGKSRKLKIGKGILKVLDNKADAYLGIK